MTYESHQEGDSERELEQVRRDLAELAQYVVGDVWSQTVVDPLWSFPLPELIPLEELGAISSLDVDSGFDEYLERYGHTVDERIRVPSKASLSPRASADEALRALPSSFLDDPALFSLAENWDFVFGESSTPAKWELRASNLQSKIDVIEEGLFQQLLRKRLEFDVCQGGIKKLKGALDALSVGISAQRGRLRALSGLGCRAAPGLCRRRENLQVVLELLKRISGTAEAIFHIKTVLDDPEATDADYAEVLLHYKDVSESAADMRGRIRALDDLLGTDDLTEAIIVEKRHAKLEQVVGDAYREGILALKATLRAEQWKYVTESEFVEALATRLDGEVVEGGKIILCGRRYGVVRSVDPLVAVLNELMLLEDKTDKTKEICESIDKARDTMALVVEALRIFNSLTSQLVLGAGAIQTAGLKTITVKTLAIACEQIELAAAIGKRVQDPCESHEELNLCVQELEIHSKEIRRKIVAVAVELLVPAMKNATVALGSTSLLSSVDEDDGLMPYFKDLVENMLRNFALVAKIVRASLREPDVDELLEDICAEISVWIRDAGARARETSEARLEVYRRHVCHLHSRFGTVWASPAINKLVMS